MAVDGMRTFLKDGGLNSLAWIATIALGGTMVACSSDPAKSSNSGSNAATGQNTNMGTTTTAGTNAGPTNNTSSGAGNVTTTGTTGGGGASGSGSVTGGGPTVGGPTVGGPTVGGPTAGGGMNTVTSTTGPAGDCGFTVDTPQVSTAIPTVGIVTWSATSEIQQAEIQFGPAGGALTMKAPVDLAEPNYRTLLLGMKSESDYQFQIVAQAGGQSCTSETYTLTTGAAPNDVPRVTPMVQQADKAAAGFFVTVNYSRGGYAFIFDADGDPVWWSEGSPGNKPEPSGVRMDFEGKAIWTVTGNPTASGNGLIRRTSMDGSDVQDLDSVDAHHDLAPLPGGSVAALIHSGGNCASIIEVHPDMSVTDLIPDVSAIYTPVMQCHPNAILYHPEDESFTVSDRNPNLYVKVSKTGDIHWQFGGNNPLGPHIQESWNVNHGHHLLANGNFLFFNNNGRGGVGSAAQSPVWEFSMNVDGLSATELWHYVSNNNSAALGDVQRLYNGNTLITYSISGVVHEVDEGGQLVRSFQTESLGYMMHRESLYGAPPK